MSHAIDHRAPSLTTDLQAQLALQFPLRTVELAGARQAFRECGSGPAIVLLHGIGSGSASWLEVAQALGRSARVIAWDAPGYGDSSPLRALAPDASDYAERLLQMLDARASSVACWWGIHWGPLPPSLSPAACSNSASAAWC